jgi:membrane protease YdiL (CAAX protease family)
MDYQETQTDEKQVASEKKEEPKMTSTNKNIQEEKKKFRLYEHPWLSLLAMILTSIFSILLSGTVIFGILNQPDDSPSVQFTQAMSFHILAGFILAPFVLHLPKGEKKYRQFLDDIGFTRVKPFFRLVLLALSCYIILALSQVATSLIYRLSQGLPVTVAFILQVLDISGDLPPESASLFISIPSMFEEVGSRGIVLTVFLSKYSERKSIIFSSLGFGLLHLLNLLNGADVVWTLGQVVWAYIIGLFYGYVFVRTHSLLPSMIVHYLGNVFIGSLTGYMQASASIATQILYGVTFSLGIVPATLMILWTKFFTSKWLNVDSNYEKPEEKN